MESVKKKCKITASARQLWELNMCVTCTKPLDSSSKLLSCLHGVCNQCIDLGLNKPGNFVCDCGVATDISKGLINCTLFCEQFDEFILRNNYIDEEYQKTEYGQYITKIPCPNCSDKYIEAYCTTCNKLHCALCQLVNHRTHHFKTISKAMEEIRSNLMKNKVNLCEKSNFANEVKSYLVSNITTLRTQKSEMKIEIQKKFDEFRDELILSEDRMMNYVESCYKTKLEHLTKNKLLMEELKKKYDFYLNFSQSALKRENRADLDMTNLVNNQLSIVIKGFMMDISGLDSTNTKFIELTAVLDDTLRKLIESVKSIAISKPPTYVKAIDAISKTMIITSFPGYHSATKKIEDIPKSIIDDNLVDKVKYNLLKQQRKSLNSSAGVSSHLDTNIDNMLAYVIAKPTKGHIVLNNQNNPTRSTPQNSSYNQYRVDEGGQIGKSSGEYPIQDGFGWTNGILL